MCTRRLTSNPTVSTGSLCDELKRVLLRTPRLNLLGTNSSMVQLSEVPGTQWSFTSPSRTYCI